MRRSIRDIREARGLTQIQLAERSGLKQATISDLETGKIKSPSVETAMRVARALEVNLDEIFPLQDNAA